MAPRKPDYTPNQMKVLHQLVQSIWEELETTSRAKAGDEHMRQYVSGLVMAHAAPDSLKIEGIKEQVRRSLKLAS